MIDSYKKLLLLLFLFLSLKLTLPAQNLNLELLSTYATGIFDEGAAEIVSYDAASQRLFTVNSDEQTVDVIDISDPMQPTLAFQIDVTSFGGNANSVDVANGLVAIAVENEDAQANGQVLLYDTDGNLLNTVPAGALPDMLIFSTDGNTIAVANEGEPNDDYTIDPEGSVTLIDVSGGAANATATQVSLSAFDDKKASLINRGVRIFGNNGQASVSQDLEPEYIAFSPDNSLAYVALQENNALLVVDVASATALDVLPLGFKDHFLGAPKLNEVFLNELPNWPDLGTPLAGGDAVQLGGFSGMYFDVAASTANDYVFYTIPDRGPNEATVSRSLVNTTQNLRPFKLPNYQARIVKFVYNTNTGNVQFDESEQIFLTRKDGTTPISGRGNISGHDEIPVTRTDASVFTQVDYSANGVDYQQLDYDAYGGDFEGILRDANGDFWMCDEYRPAIYHFQPNGQLIERYVPKGTSMLGDEVEPEGTYGKESLPVVYNKRRANRGFEAIALDTDENILYAFIQTPLYNPDSQTRNQSDVIRILGIDPATGDPVREYVYLLERNRDAGVGLSRVDKIGDAVYAGNGRFLILERDSSTPDDGNEGKKYIFEFFLDGASNILGTPLAEKDNSTGPNDKTLEMMTADEIVAAGIQPVHKTKVLNLPSIGYLPSDKPEGIALLPNDVIAVMNDNDFGLAGAGVSDVSSLGLISFQYNYGFDASDRVEDIRLWQRPCLGMYQPDAMVSYSVDGKTYLVTANEGDARDYDGYSEEERVDDLDLGPTYFPNQAYLQSDESLGRLKTTSANGDIDGDGQYEQIYSYGARSFSIWDAFGNLVFDSGDQFEKILSQVDPEHFNSTNDDNDSYKNRSDDKGAEPEAVNIATIDGISYAFIGLERMGGIMIFDISNPHDAQFVDYINNRNFNLPAESTDAGDLGPEDIIFIDANDSPNGSPLVVTSSEVSGTVSLFGILPEDARFQLQLLHNNDAESQLVNAGQGLENIGGVDRFKTVVDSLRYVGFLKKHASILLSSGDNFLAGPEFSASLIGGGANGEYYDALAVKLLNYDAICLGNHDFDFGPEVCAKFIEDTRAPLPSFLSANLDFSEEPVLQQLVNAGRIASSTVIWRDGEQIGVIGLTTPDLPFISSPRNVKVNDALVSIVQGEVDALTAKGVNKIILISHLQSINEEQDLVTQISGVDIVIAGGGDELLANSPNLALPGEEVAGEYPMQVMDAVGETVYLVTTPGEYRYVGQLLVTFDNNGKVVEIGADSDPVLVKTARPDPVFTNLIVNPVKAYLDNLAANVIASTEVDLDGVRDNIRTEETNQGNLIADAILWQANQLAAGFGQSGAMVALQNGGGIRNNNIIAAGSPISELTTFDMLPFGNFVSLVDPIPASQFKEILENAVARVEDINGRFTQIAGCRFIWNPDGTSQTLDDEGNVVNPGNRIVSAILDDGTVIVENGQLVAGAPEIRIATVNFLASGGDQYPFRGADFNSLGVTYQQALFNYIREQLNGQITAAAYPEGGEGRIQRLSGSAAIAAGNREQNLPAKLQSVDLQLNVFPNPFIEQVILSYDLDQDQEIELYLSNTEGKRLVTLQTLLQSAGQHQLELTDVMKDIAPGAYFISLQTKAEVQTIGLQKQ
ncbi:MAG: choice-of-anchor I family protein [Bacteroidota bacterium]